VEIFVAIFFLLAGAGAWRAWRRNPLYSVRATLKLAGAFLAMFGVIVGLTHWISSAPARDPLQTTAIIVVAIALVVAGFSAFVLTLSEGPLAQLPPSVVRMDFHRRRLRPWLWAGGVVLLAIAVPALFVSSALILLFAFFFLMLSSVLLPLYFKASRFDRGATTLIANPWVHWRYTPQEWETWVAAQPAARQRRYRKPGTRPAEAYLGAAGLLFGNEYCPWLASGCYLKAAALGKGDLVFRFQVYMSTAGRPERRIPIPAEGRADLERLDQKLRESCPTAAIGLVARRAS
jgi:hypothetical protein